tara:strand:+ start:427 stop:1038 length:612 start_codon:yes stop_codon:yes gene_type:complete
MNRRHRGRGRHRNNKVNPDIKAWGPCFWYFYHRVAYDFDEKKASENEKYKRGHLILYNNFEKILPCHKCRNHYRRLKNNRPVEKFINTQKELFEWSIVNHNRVNKRLKKKEISLEKAKEIYSKPLRRDMLKKFINYLIFLSLQRNNLGIIKKIFNNLIYTIPCETYRKGLTQRLNWSNNLKNINLPIGLKKWYSRNHNFHNGL